MTDYEQIVKISGIYGKLQDEESKKIFEAKVSLMIYKDRIQFWDKIKHGKKWEAFNLKDDAYFIFGAGRMGGYIREQIEMAGSRVTAFLENDSSKVGSVINGIPVMEVKAAGRHPGVPIVFSSRPYEDEMRGQLSSLGIGNPTIREEEVCLFCGTQYFDVFKPGKNEVFVDAGAYDGGTVKDFIQWCGGDYRMIYAFEPDKANYAKCRRFIEAGHVERVRLIPKGTYRNGTVLEFDASGDGSSHIGGGGMAEIA